MIGLLNNLKKQQFFIKVTILLLFFIISLFVVYIFLSEKFSTELKQVRQDYELEKQQIIQAYELEKQSDKSLIRYAKKYAINLELDVKRKGADIQTSLTEIKLKKDLELKKYRLYPGFYSGINENYPGTGFIDFHDDNILILSSKGILAFQKNVPDLQNFLQIRNNINAFIGLDEFKRNKWYSIKDLHIFNNKIFVSYNEQIKKDCWNTSVIYADLNYKYIRFKKLFSAKDCVNSIKNIYKSIKNIDKSIKNIDKEFNAHQSGGRIVSLDNNNILLSIGDYRNRHLAQNKKSLNGKIIKINLQNMEYEIISMGHRNPQGMYIDRDNNFLLETEHGPKGGDEINLIDIQNISNGVFPNYGWAISSYGEHYGGVSEQNKRKYENYPLFKSHSEYGFIEPLHYFVPSIGISELVKIGKNEYVVSAMKDKSIFFFSLNKQNQIIDLDRIEVFERVRDLKFQNGNLFLFLEDTASLGIINLK